MSCRQVDRWVSRHGVVEIPPEWHDHIAACPKCEALVRQVGILDGLIAGTPVPDPGEAYWSSFAPRVARGIEAVPLDYERRAAYASWIRIWVPTVGVAALAFFIGRELYFNHQSLSVSETSVPIVREDKGAPANGSLSPASPATANVANPPAGGSGDRQAARQAQTSHGRGELAKPSGSEPAVIAPPSAYLADEPPRFENLNLPSAGASEATVAPAPTESGRRDDGRVWPDRQVSIVGEIRPDTHKQAVADDKRLAEQGPHALLERGFVDGAPGAETSAAGMAPLGRLEARQSAVARFPDSQSPTEAMRQFDKLRELRRQIGIIQSISPAARTAEQNREMCMLWYQVGQIATDSALLDSAIENLGACTKALDVPESAEWKKRSDELLSRRSPTQR